MSLPLPQIFPPIDSLPASGLTPRISRLDRFFWPSPFYVFSFFIILFCLVPCGRLSWLLVSFWVHVNIVHHIISYHVGTRQVVHPGNPTCRQKALDVGKSVRLAQADGQYSPRWSAFIKMVSLGWFCGLVRWKEVTFIVLLLGASHFFTRSTCNTIKSCVELIIVSDSVVMNWPYFLT